jgi:hypothetical protein
MMGTGRMLLVGGVLAATFLLSFEGLRPPAPKPSDAPSTQFSAGRAYGVLARLLGAGLPHPAGSATNDAVRIQITEELNKLGYQPELQSAFACNLYGNCATVKNILARLNGADRSPAVLLAAHYDSVPAGPGASDDGMGIAAVLEIARALKSLQAPRNTIILLLTDGEEAGMLGAQAFVDIHPWAREVRAAVNIDTRGSSGPSLMFETGSANDWAVRLYAEHATRPATTSIAYTVYKMLPNDTDFSIFRSAGYQGLNFANIGDVATYHTPLDNLENVNSATLQHHGDAALQMVVALANSDLRNLAMDTAPSAGELSNTKHQAVFFDVFGRKTIWWEARRTLLFAFIGALLLFLQVALLLYNKRLAVKELLWGLLAWFVTIVATGTFALLLKHFLVLTGAIPVKWVAHPLPLLIAFWAFPLATVAILALAFARRACFWGLWSGVWVWWAILSIVISWLTPGMSYVLLIPTAVAALAGLPFTLWRSIRVPGRSLAALLPLAVAGMVGFAVPMLLYEAMGIDSLVTMALLVGLIFTASAPFCVALRGSYGLPMLMFPGVPVAVVVLAVFGAVIAPAYSAKSPQHVNIECWQDTDSGTSQWIAFPASGVLPEPIRLATPFHRLQYGPFPWGSESAFVANAPHVDVNPPTFTILESSVAGNRREFLTLLRSERGAPEATVLFPPDAGVELVRIEGEPVVLEKDIARRYLNGWSAFNCLTMPAKGVQVSFTLPVGRPVEVIALDRSFSLPLEGMFLLKSRPLAAVPFQNGDVTLVSRHVQLLP